MPQACDVQIFLQKVGGPESSHSGNEPCTYRAYSEQAFRGQVAADYAEDLLRELEQLKCGLRRHITGTASISVAVHWQGFGLARYSLSPIVWGGRLMFCL